LRTFIISFYFGKNLFNYSIIMNNSIIEQVSNREQLTNSIQKWVTIDTQLKLVNEKVKKMKEIKNILNDQICNYMTKNNLSKNTIGISDGELKIHEKNEYSSISFTYIERCLAEIISDKAQVDYIIKYLKDNREVTKSIDIKRTYKKDK